MNAKRSKEVDVAVGNGLLEKVGKAKKDSYYRKQGQEIPKGLFSRVVDNKSRRGNSPS